MWLARGAHRMMEDRVQRLVSTNGIDFDCEKAWNILVKRGRAWTQGDSREGLIEARLAEDGSSVFFRYIQDLECATSHKTFCALFTVGMGGSGAMGQYDTDLQTFAPVAIFQLNSSQSATMERIRTALGTWEAFMVFSCGTQLEGVVKDAQARLFRGDLSYIVWEPSYIKYLLDRPWRGSTRMFLKRRPMPTIDVMGQRDDVFMMQQGWLVYFVPLSTTSKPLTWSRIIFCAQRGLGWRERPGAGRGWWGSARAEA